MNFIFKKISSKTLSVISILKFLHKEKKIGLIQDAAINTEYLHISKQNIRIDGLLSILHFLKKKNIAESSIDLQWWLMYDFKQYENGSLKAYIPQSNLYRVEQLLNQNKFLGGDKIGEPDIITYINIYRNQPDLPNDFKDFPKLSQWYKEVDSKLQQYTKQEFIDKELEATKKAIEISEQHAQKQQQKKEKAKDKKEKKEKPVATEKKAAPKAAKKKDDIDPEYLKTFNAQKIQRLTDTKDRGTSSDKKNVLITSALPYCNNAPHLGTLIGCVLSADVYSRYCRLRGYNSLYVCGTDEYGTATEMRAKQEGLTPNEICQKYWKIHDSVYRWFDIDFDIFGRTHTPKHTEITQEIFKDLKSNNLINEKTSEQYFCENCDTFLADRFVKGTCPHCQSTDAKGDQCDSCSKLIEQIQNPKCVHCDNTPVMKDTNHFYIQLPKLQDNLESWMQQSSVEGFWSSNSVSVSKAWIKQGLQERCITRDLKWGTPVPVAGWEKKVFYVWFDAPIGYISITANHTKNWEQWWKDPKNVFNVQFMAKDNIPFHCVIFPCTLLGQTQPWTKLNHISACEYLNYEDKKFSKSAGTGVFGDDAEKTGVPSEVWRYYLLSNRPEKSDTVFTWRDFANKNNNELLANPGNLANRGLKFCYKEYNKKTPSYDPKTLTEADKAFLNDVWAVFLEYCEDLDKVEIKKGLEKVMAVSSLGNTYIQQNQPWVKENKESNRSATILFVYCNLLKFLSIMFEPYLPSLSAKINFMLGLEKRQQSDENIIETFLANKNDGVNQILSLVKPNQPINQPVTLFREFTDSEIEGWKLRFGGQQQ